MKTVNVEAMMSERNQLPFLRLLPAVLAAEKVKSRLVHISTKEKGTSARKLKSLVLFWSELVWSGLEAGSI